MRPWQQYAAGVTLAAAALLVTVWRHEHPIPFTNVVSRSVHLSSAHVADGAWTQNDALARYTQHIARSEALRGQETVAVGSDGRSMWIGAEDGWLRRVTLEQGNASTHNVAFIGGRILGMVLDAGSHEVGERLIACDVSKGLIRITGAPERVHVTLLATTAPDTREDAAMDALGAGGSPHGRSILYCDDLDVDRVTGDIYFSDAMAAAPWRSVDDAGRVHWSTMLLSKWDFLSGANTGRLIVYNAAAGSTRTLLHGLSFANGVALTPSRDAVLVAETFNARILRYWLTGPRAGFSELFTDLPGMPDGISTAHDGGLWVAMPSLITPLVAAASRITLLRAIVVLLPPRWWPAAPPYGLLAKLDADGVPQFTLHDPRGQHVNFVTAVTEQRGDGGDVYLLLGQLHGDSIPRVALAPAMTDAGVVHARRVQY